MGEDNAEWFLAEEERLLRDRGEAHCVSVCNLVSGEVVNSTSWQLNDERCERVQVALTRPDTAAKLAPQQCDGVHLRDPRSAPLDSHIAVFISMTLEIHRFAANFSSSPEKCPRKTSFLSLLRLLGAKGDERS